MKSRLLVAAVGVPLLFYIVLAGAAHCDDGGAVRPVGVAAMELMQCVGVAKRSFLFGWTVICAVFSVTWYYDRPEYMEVLWFLYVLVTFFFAIYKAGEIKLVHILAGLFAVIAIPYSFSAFIRMEDAGIPRVCLLLPFIFSFLSDTGGYFGGRFFGKHKLAPKVSPKKTVEGSIGGLVGNVLGAVIFAAVMNRWFYAGIVNSYLGMIFAGPGVQCGGTDRRPEFFPHQTGIRHQGLWASLFGARRCAGPV